MRGSIYQMFGGAPRSGGYAPASSSDIVKEISTPPPAESPNGHRRRRDSHYVFLGLLCFYVFSGPAHGAIDLGIDVLEQSNYAILKGKRVGLVTNQTGVNRKGIRTR